VERLAAAITTVVSDKELQRRVAVLGERIRTEDGVARAVEVIQYHLSSFM
jgi:sterol 3beta-glucosyltransferase